MPRTTIRLPFGIAIERVSRVCTRLTSELRLEFVDLSKKFDSHGELAAHAVESLLAALVAEGVEMDASAAGRAVTSAAETERVRVTAAYAPYEKPRDVRRWH